MGHRFSKTAAIRQNENKRKSLPAQKFNASTEAALALASNRHSLPATSINLQFEEESPASTETTTQQQAQIQRRTSKRSYTSSCSSNSSARQIIIKIQLAKMENGNHHQHDNGGAGISSGAIGDTTATTTTIRLDQLQQAANIMPTTTTTTNALIHHSAIMAEGSNNSSSSSSTTRNSNSRTAGSSANSTLLLGHINAIQIDAGSRTHDNDNDLVEYCEVLEQDADQLQQEQHHLNHISHLCDDEVILRANNNNNTNKCCNRKSRNSLPATTATTAGTALTAVATTPTTSTSRRRCCKCTCRDAFRRLMEPKYYKNKQQAKAIAQAQQQQQLQQQQQQQQLQQQQQHSTELQWPVVSAAPAPLAPTPYPSIPAEAIASLRSLPMIPATTTTCTTATITATPLTATNNSNSSSSNNNIAAGGNIVNSQLSIWASNPHNRQFVVVSCPPTSVLTVGHVDEHSIRLMATEDLTAMARRDENSDFNSISQSSPKSSAGIVLTPAPAPASPHTPGPTVHSQVDYMHCLVPDLEKITNSSFYWGKMDRYEAERLLEGKPEGTFLLRDSAQEEFLFSVTFRKYGRSLHARIEQSGHKFSFDCHDPCVFTAPTVTGLLEHYKDPACVMFFEPMLTIPLHRKTTFSLQKLCRATIVSNITYDGINELELPLRLKSYLKEYHYKQKLRVKPLDDPLYGCT